MTRAQKETDLRVKGLGLAPRFALTMSLSLLVVLTLAGYVLYRSLTTIAASIHEDQIERSVLVTSQKPYFEQQSKGMRRDAATGVEKWEVRYGDDLDGEATLFQFRSDPNPDSDVEPTQLFVPKGSTKLGSKVLGLLVGILVAVLLISAGVAAFVAVQVTQPIHKIVRVVRLIAKGELNHRAHVRGGGEIELLARSIDRMTKDLQGAQEAELELSIREREMGLASEVREALLPMGTPEVPGYDLGSAHFGSTKPGGDFHEFISLGDGKLGVLVCDVSGQGVPAALIGATARSYLRNELQRGDDVAEAFKRVNKELVRDVRRGMFVTALYAVLDSREHTLSVTCAGHKVPLLRVCKADGSLRSLHPEGIALGLDKGPVFDRTLSSVDAPVDPGDRIVLSTSGTLRVASPEGEELGEKRFFGLVMKHADSVTPKFLKGLRVTLEKYAGGEGFPADISLVTILRES